MKNVGNATHTGPVLLEYLVEGDVIGTQTIGLGGANVMLPGTTNSESELFAFKNSGKVDVQVRIANPESGDWSSANDSRTETFFFNVPAEQPDLTITDLRVVGGWGAGSTVNLRANIENIGDEGWNLLLGQPQVKYFVRYEGDTSWTSVGTDALTLGLPSGGSDWEDVSFKLVKDGPFEVRADVLGNDSEKSYLNNSKSEFAGFSRADAPKKTIANSAEDVELAMLLARTVYGGVGIPEDYRDAYENGLKDDYRGNLDTIGFDVLTSADFGQDFRPVDELSKFYSGGLFAGDQGIASSNSDKWQAQGLVAVSNDEFDGPKTMTLTFRGTDGKDLAESTLGQAYTGDGLYDYYESMRPLIDAHRLRDDIDLTVVSFASSGLNPAFLSQTYVQKGMLGQYDAAESLDPLLVSPSFYIGVSHAIDMVTFPENNPSTPSDSIPGTLFDDVLRLFNSEFKIPNETLLANMNMHDALISIETPNMDRGGPRF